MFKTGEARINAALSGFESVRQALIIGVEEMRDKRGANHERINFLEAENECLLKVQGRADRALAAIGAILG